MRLLPLLLLSLLIPTGLSWSVGFAWSATRAQPIDEACLGTLEHEVSRQDFAESLGLVYFETRPPGFSRTVTPGTTRKTVRENGESVTKDVVVYDMRYFDADGTEVTDEATLAYFASLKIPPAHRDV